MPRKRTGGAALSARLRSHLGHIRACERSGEALKPYAARKGLSIHALYQAKRELRRRGVRFEGGPSRRSGRRGGEARSSSPAFVEAVRRDAVPRSDAAWRVRLPGGAVFESRVPLGSEETLRLLRELGGGGS